MQYKWGTAIDYARPGGAKQKMNIAREESSYLVFWARWYRWLRILKDWRRVRWLLVLDREWSEVACSKRRTVHSQRLFSLLFLVCSHTSQETAKNYLDIRISAQKNNKRFNLFEHTQRGERFPCSNPVYSLHSSGLFIDTPLLVVLSIILRTVHVHRISTMQNIPFLLLPWSAGVWTETS